MKKLLLILAITFASVATFSYANSLTNSPDLLIAANNPPRRDCQTVSLYSDNTFATYYGSFDFCKIDEKNYIVVGKSKYPATTMINNYMYSVIIEGKKYYFKLS